MTFDIRRLEVLRAVVELGSFSRAAAGLSLSQPAVSRQIAALERELGVGLVERGQAAAIPTAAGRSLLADAAKILPAVETAGRRLREITDEGGGAVRLGSIPSAMTSVVPPAILALRKTRPRVEIWLEEGWSAGLSQKVARGDLDLALVATHEGDAEVLVEEPFSVLVKSGSRLTRRRRLTLADLAAEPWILAPDTGGHGAVLDSCLRAGFTPRKVAIAGWDSAATLVAIGLGVALAPHATASRLAARPGVTALDLDDPPRRPLRLLVSPGERTGAEKDLELRLRDSAIHGPSGLG